MVSSGGYIYEYFLSKCCEAGNLLVLVESLPGLLLQASKCKVSTWLSCFVLCYPHPSRTSALRNGFSASLPWSCVCHRDLPGSGSEAASLSFIRHSTDLSVNKTQGIYLTGLLSCSLQRAAI